MGVPSLTTFGATDPISSDDVLANQQELRDQFIGELTADDNFDADGGVIIERVQFESNGSSPYTSSVVFRHQFRAEARLRSVRAMADSGVDGSKYYGFQSFKSSSLGGIATPLHSAEFVDTVGQWEEVDLSGQTVASGSNLYVTVGPGGSPTATTMVVEISYSMKRVA